MAGGSFEKIARSNPPGMERLPATPASRSTPRFADARMLTRTSMRSLDYVLVVLSEPLDSFKRL